MKTLAILVLTALAAASAVEIYNPIGILGSLVAAAGFGVLILSSQNEEKMYL